MKGEPKKKKTDYEALNSALMRIPKMDIETARALINLGYREVFQLIGLSPEALFEEIKKKNPDIGKELLSKLKIATDFAENPNSDIRNLIGN